MLMQTVIEVLYAPPLLGGALSNDAVWRLSVCRLSVSYIGPKSRTESPRKTKIGTEVAPSHVTSTPLSMSKGQQPRSPGCFTHRGVYT